MDDVTLGLDFGTSYVKAVMRRTNGSIASAARCPSPRLPRAGFVSPYPGWWRRLRTVATGVGDWDKRFEISGLCISAIAPTLTVFDAKDGERAISVPYSSSLALGQLPIGLTRDDITESRLRALKMASAGLREPRVTDLVGYLNWCLTGEFTLNSVCLAEMGFDVARAQREFAFRGGPPPRIVAPAERIGTVSRIGARRLGMKVSTPVCGGCPDTLSSIVGSGAERPGDMMVYLGTFGSLLKLALALPQVLDSSATDVPPYKWLLSVPGLGPWLEKRSSLWFPRAVAQQRLACLDREASRSSPGADGYFFLLPRWHSPLQRVGRFALRSPSAKPQRSRTMLALAALEALGYAISAAAPGPKAAMYVAGGGSRSRIWLKALATVVDAELVTSEDAWEATGAAIIANRMAHGITSATCSVANSLIVSPERNRAQVIENARRAVATYKARGWI